jgi:spore coat protein YutH
MFERDVYIQYQLAIDRRFRVDTIDGFQAGGEEFVLVPIQLCTMQEPSELLNITQFLNYTGDQGIAQLVPTANKQFEAMIDGNPVYLFRIPKIKCEPNNDSIGKQLAAFHDRGSKYQPLQADMIRFGQWAELWGSRVDHIKALHTKILKTGGGGSFDQLFMDSFPYYEGLAENAIQYVVDTDIDSRIGFRSSTITHQRFKQNTWIKSNDQSDYVKLPIHFVHDDPMRDVAEWIRNTIQMSGSQEEIEQFLKDYNETRELSADDIRKLYGRLLFPISYIDTIESYYITKRNTVKQYLLYELEQVLRLESENELFLRDFFKHFHLNRNSRIFIPRVEWLNQ